MKKNIFTLMVILWMAIIFSFSAQPADESEQMSLSVGHVAGLLFADGYEDWPQERQDAVLGVLLALMYRAYGHKGKRLFLLSAGTGSLYAATDEFHQLFVEGRSCQLTDWGIDTCGVIAGAAVVFLLWRVVGRRKREMES